MEGTAEGAGACQEGGGLLFILALQYGENRPAAIMGAVGLLSDADLRDATESWE